MNNFINYNNDLDVLNEGFFDFIWKLSNRVFHAMFKSNNFEDLYKRIDELETIIKHGKTKVKESVNYNGNILNESRRRRSRIVEDSSTSTDDASKNDNNASNDIDINSKPVNLDKINMNIPSFPVVAKQLLDNLKKQYDDVNKQVSLDKIKEDIVNVRNGQRISQRYVQALEVFTTDFLRKYSKGGISLPRPTADKPLSYNEILGWQKLANSVDKHTDEMFKSVKDAMEKILTNYQNAFEQQLQDLKSNEDKFIEKFKDSKSARDSKFITDWENKIKSRLDVVMTSCRDYIPVAINVYFISDDIYKNALNYATSALELLIANNKNIVSTEDGDNNIIYKMQEQFEEDPDVLVTEVNDFISELSDEQKRKYFHKNNITIIDKSFIENILNDEKLLNKCNKKTIRQIDIIAKNLYNDSETLKLLVFRILLYIANNKLDILKNQLDNEVDKK